MTIEQAKAKLLAWVSAQIGYREGSGNFNKYAAMPELVKLYGGSLQNKPWCDVFTDAAFVTVFGLKIGAAMTYQTIGNGSALCRDSAQYFKDHGAFSRQPEPGDVVFFYVGGQINHQGIVLRVVGGSIITVEGNSSDSVAERCYSLTDPSIAGYGRPRWELAAEAPAVSTTAPDEAETSEEKPESPDFGFIDGFIVEPPTLRNGMGGVWVAAMQGALQFLGYSLGPDGVDGDFGYNTTTAVRNFQIRNGLSPDGVCGPMTWEALLSK